MADPVDDSRTVLRGDERAAGTGAAGEGAPPSRILVVVPAFNERASIGGVIEAVRAALPAASVLVVDDGSEDATGEVARGKGAEVARLPFNCGIGAAVQTGYMFAARGGYDIVVQIDADGQHDPGQARLLIEPILEGKADLSIGSRFLVNKGYSTTAARRFGIAWLSSLVSLLVGGRLSDPTSGFRAAGREVIRFFAEEYPADYPEPEVLLVLHRAGFRLREVPVVMSQRLAGRSSITLMRSVYYLFKVTLAILMGQIRSPLPRRRDDV